MKYNKNNKPKERKKGTQKSVNKVSVNFKDFFTSFPFKFGILLSSNLCTG